MPERVCHNNLLNCEQVFNNSGDFLHPFPEALNGKSEGIVSLLSSPVGREKNSGSNERIREDYDGNRNIFSISSGGAGDVGPGSWTLEERGSGCESDSPCLGPDVIEVVRNVRRNRLQSCIKMMFNEFCETTGLHGWKYLTRVRSSILPLITLTSTC